MQFIFSLSEDPERWESDPESRRQSARHAPREGPVSEIHEWFLEITHKKGGIQIKNGQKIQTGVFTKEDPKWLITPGGEEMQTKTTAAYHQWLRLKSRAEPSVSKDVEQPEPPVVPRGCGWHGSHGKPWGAAPRTNAHKRLAPAKPLLGTNLTGMHTLLTKVIYKDDRAALSVTAKNKKPPISP